MYTTFAFSCIWGYREAFINRDKTYRKKALLLTAGISIAYGGVTELIQEFLVPTRTGDWFDFLSDTLGTFFGLSIFYLFFKNKK